MSFQRHEEFMHEDDVGGGVVQDLPLEEQKLSFIFRLY